MTIKQILQYISKHTEGTNYEGRRNRTWLAVILSIVSIAVDYTLVVMNYDYLPNRVAILYDWNNMPIAWADKSVFFEYETERVLLLVVLSLISVLIYKRKGGSAVAQRIICFLMEMTMLAITTGVGISIAALLVEMHDPEATVSDYWENAIMLFWAVVMTGEMLYDFYRMKQAETIQRTAPNPSGTRPQDDKC